MVHVGFLDGGTPLLHVGIFLYEIVAYITAHSILFILGKEAYYFSCHGIAVWSTQATRSHSSADTLPVARSEFLEARLRKD